MHTTLQQDMRVEVSSYSAKFALSQELDAMSLRPCFSVAAQEERYLCPGCKLGQPPAVCDYCRSVDPNAAACVVAWHKIGDDHDGMAAVEQSGARVPDGVANCMRVKATMPAERPYPVSGNSMRTCSGLGKLLCFDMPPLDAVALSAS